MEDWGHGKKKTPGPFSPEACERTAGLVFAQMDKHDPLWTALCSIASKIGCRSATLLNWLRQAERDERRRGRLTTDEGEPLRAVAREVRALRRPNETLREASAFFAPPLGERGRSRVG